MSLHESVFYYNTPTPRQMEDMQECREAFTALWRVLNHNLPNGPDKTYIARTLRTCAMWANITITRDSDGMPRESGEVPVREYPPDHPVKGDLGSVPT